MARIIEGRFSSIEEPIKHFDRKSGVGVKISSPDDKNLLSNPDTKPEVDKICEIISNITGVETSELMVIPALFVRSQASSNREQIRVEVVGRSDLSPLLFDNRGGAIIVSNLINQLSQRAKVK
jgi:hypothetical protein